MQLQHYSHPLLLNTKLGKQSMNMWQLPSITNISILVYTVWINIKASYLSRILRCCWFSLKDALLQSPATLASASHPLDEACRII
jgi:hypothetical protein